LTVQQVRFESVNLLDGQFNVPHGALLSHSCRKKLKEGLHGSASEKNVQWCKLLEGRSDMAIDIAVHCVTIIKLGSPVLFESSMRCDIHLDDDEPSACSSVSVARIKSQLHQKHGIDWSDTRTGYTLRRLHDERASSQLDDDSQEIETGALLIMFPTNPEHLLQLPRVVFDLPAETIEIDGVQAIPVNIKALDSDCEQFVELVLPLSCSVMQLKQQLHAAGVDWVLDHSKVMSFSNKPMKIDAIIPPACDMPIKVVQHAT
jgi:hypothetical protein